MNMKKVSIESVLGATYPKGSEQITIFIPEKDRNGKAINQKKWTDNTLGILGTLFRGATAFPPGKGVWRDDSKGGKLLFEKTVMVISYTTHSELMNKLKGLRKFLHRFGRETHQGEVGLIINDTYYGISTYDTQEENI